MRYLDLYGGIGGFRLGIERATSDWKCVWYCDIDKYATKVYNKNFRETNTPSDVRKLPAGSIPEHDLICGGYPCQSFSLAGRRAGFEDTRGTLFFEICRIAKECGTPYLFLENVKGLLSHDAGRTFATMLMALDDLGYRVQWEVLNSKNYGVPQNRERVFIIANLRDRPAPEGDVHLKSGAVRMLKELASRHPLGLTKGQLAAYTGFSTSGGAYSSYLSNLRRGGYIEEDQHHNLRASEAGMDYLGETPLVPITHEEIMAMWSRNLKSGCYRMLEVLVQEYPEELSYVDLAERANFAESGGGFSSYLSTLRRNGLIETHAHMAKASEALFP